MDIVFVITGSLREVDQLKKVLNGAFLVQQACPRVVEIRLSTTDDSDIVKKILKTINAPSVRVIQCDPPPIVVKGHRLHQILQLQNATADLAPETWVMKVRTDKLIVPSEMLIACLREVVANPAPFEGKFGVVEGLIFLPWYVNDMAYLGQARVLREIISFDVGADIFSPALATEQVIWSRLLGEDAPSFFNAARRFSQMTRFELERSGPADVGAAFDEIRPWIHRYWSILASRFFSISHHRFREVHPLLVGNQEIISDRIFSRYGNWGASFSDPTLFLGLVHRFFPT